MAKLAKCLLADVVPTLENISMLDQPDIVPADPEDLFLCALGFEPRCLTLPNYMKETGYRARKAVYLKYDTNLDDNTINLSELENHLRIIAPSVEPIEADRPDFPSWLRGLLDLVMSESSGKLTHVTMDISVMANRLILRCMKVLFEYDIRLRIVYSEAAIYHPTKEEYEKDPSKWEKVDLLGLERGVSEVTPSIDHPGQALDPLPDCLLLFPSYKADRSKAVISFVDPSLLTSPGKKVVWLLGVPHLEQDRWRLDAMKKINEISSTARQYELSTFDYKETLRVLDTLYSEISDRYRITISPLGSKMQALGIALFSYIHPDIRVIFSIPKEYNATQYSEGCKGIWKIDLGDLAQTRTKLDSVGTIRIEE